MKKVVILSGAGISAESGLKTFRDSDGLWENYDVYEIASPMGWAKNPQLVLDFYNARRQNVLDAQPNKAHLLLAQLEKSYDVTIITQNIDDLHERAGSTNIVHLHGEITKMRSVANELATYPYAHPIKLGDLAKDGHQLRPFIVWFGESVPMIEKAAAIMTTADICVIIGTSLQVYPAAGLIEFAPIDIPIYIIDKLIPELVPENYIKIEKPATEGVEELVKMFSR
jgi:NAD-dependent deacetylase